MPTSVQYAASTEPSRALRVGGGVGLLQGGGRRAVGVLDVGDPVAEPVVHGDLERDVRDEVLQPGAVAGGVGEPDDARARLGLERLDQHRREVAARVAEAVLHLEAQPDRAVRAGQGGRGHRQQRAELHAAAVADPVAESQRRGRGGDDLPHGDQVALAGDALERPGDVRRDRAAALPWQAL